LIVTKDWSIISVNKKATALANIFEGYFDNVTKLPFTRRTAMQVLCLATNLDTKANKAYHLPCPTLLATAPQQGITKMQADRTCLSTFAFRLALVPPDIINLAKCKSSILNINLASVTKRDGTLFPVLRQYFPIIRTMEIFTTTKNKGFILFFKH